MDMMSRARHEFGHYVVSRVMGFQTGLVSAEIDGSTGGKAEIDTSRVISTISEVEKFCEDRIRVLYAGVLAESLNNGKINNFKAIELAKSTGKNDHMMVQQLCMILRNIRYGSMSIDEAEAKMQEDELRLWRETAEIVTLRSELIEKLAKQIFDRRAVHGKPAYLSAVELANNPLLSDFENNP